MADDARFCTECGAKLTVPEPAAPAAPAADTVPAPVPAPEPVPAPAPAPDPVPAPSAQPAFGGSAPAAAQIPAYVAPAPAAAYSAPAAPAVPQKTEYTEKPAGFFEYFGLMLLFGLPVLGFIFKIIFVFAPKKKSLRNFSWVMLLFEVLAVILSVIGIILAVSFIDELEQALEAWKNSINGSGM